MSFLNSIILLRTIPCLAEPSRIIIVGIPDRSLNDVIPYLATLPGIIAYNPIRLTLTFRRQPGFLTIEPEKVYITQVRDADEGIELLSALKDAINATWEDRHQLKPVTERKLAARHLDIFTLLPQTNCKLCGESTCLAFAVLLVQQKRSLDECLPMHQDVAFSNRRVTLEAMLYA